MSRAAEHLMRTEKRPAAQAGSKEEESRALFYAAICRRDAAFDGLFYTGVLTTGIYCRPSCPARTPKLENVRFFAAPEEAEAAGLRACLRCKPKDAHPKNEQLEKVQAMCRLIAGAEEEPSLEELARHVALSPGRAQKLFKQTLTVTPKQFAAATRLERFRKAARDGQSVTGAIYEAGYGSSSRFYEKESANLGMRPRDYGRKGEGLSIAWACRKTSLGTLLIAGTAKGLCLVRIGSGEKALEADLKAEFPKADFHKQDAALAKWADALAAYAEGQADWPLLPLDIAGTAFQAKVWAALRAIPRGQTATYGDIAKAIGLPKAHRAVANACAANPVALAVPCHRILPASGGTGGYRWGTARKKKLLALEEQD